MPDIRDYFERGEDISFSKSPEDYFYKRIWRHMKDGLNLGENPDKESVCAASGRLKDLRVYLCNDYNGETSVMVVTYPYSSDKRFFDSWPNILKKKDLAEMYGLEAKTCKQTVKGTNIKTVDAVCFKLKTS